MGVITNFVVKNNELTMNEGFFTVTIEARNIILAAL